MKRKRIYKKLVIIFMIVCAITLVYSSVAIVNWYLSNKKNAKLKEELNNVIVINEKTNDDLNTNENTKTYEYNIDFKTLKEKNSDTAAYLKVPNTNIDYVVVKGKDNSYYLNHNFNKDWNVSGWIFMDYRNNLDGNDKNIIVYGHNTQDGSMFGTLKKILNEDWYNNEENMKITLVTENETAIYQVMSIYSIEKEDYYIQTEFETLKDYKLFLDKIKLRSIKPFNVEVYENSKILTLSSCMPGGVNRVVLHAVKIN